MIAIVRAFLIAVMFAAAASPCWPYAPASDRLGSVRMATDKEGNVLARHDYLPFGEEMPVDDDTFGRPSDLKWGEYYQGAQRFTGKERDTESDLDYFGARYYSGAMGRFSTTDPLLASGRPAEPQSWNRYAYVFNRPLGLVDPDGMDPKDERIGGLGSLFNQAISPVRIISAMTWMSRRHLPDADLQARIVEEALPYFVPENNDQWRGYVTIEAATLFGPTLISNPHYS
ncbi:MAG: RHS repeat-associated core domain-containing protein [Vicinamibacteria bacterium]|nr:RHS repeat-associated core domain-containing protein [Vicinamibacteria bacterium]